MCTFVILDYKGDCACRKRHSSGTKPENATRAMFGRLPKHYVSKHLFCTEGGVNYFVDIMYMRTGIGKQLSHRKDTVSVV